MFQKSCTSEAVDTYVFHEARQPSTTASGSRAVVAQRRSYSGSSKLVALFCFRRGQFLPAIRTVVSSRCMRDESLQRLLTAIRTVVSSRCMRYESFLCK